MAAHDESEICVIQNDYDDSFNTARVNFLGVSAWPTAASDGVSDVYPASCLEPDFLAHAAIPSPLVLTISEEGQGQFTAHITAEEDVSNAAFFMVATLDEDVPSSSGMSHLPHHVKVFMTPPSTGDPFALAQGESIDISHSFTVLPGWDYELMGVAAWVSRPGGTNPSSCTYGNMGNMNQVLQSRWVPAGGTPAAVELAWAPAGNGFMLSTSPNPFNPTTTISYELPRSAPVSLRVYDLQGRLVNALVVDQIQTAGRHAVRWDGRDAEGHRLPSGLYLCNMTAGDHAENLRMVMIR